MKNLSHEPKARVFGVRNVLLATLLIFLSPLGSHAQSCGDGDTLAVLKGAYGFDGRGIDHGGSLGTARQVVVSGRITFDGAGGASNPSTLTLNQNITGTDSDIRYTGGTYSLNSDCSYTVTFNSPSLRTIDVKAVSKNGSGVATILTMQDETIIISGVLPNDIAMDAILDNRGATGCIQADLGFEWDGDSKGVDSGQNVQLTLVLNVNGSTGSFTGDATNGTRTYSGTLTITSDCRIGGVLQIGGGSSVPVRGLLAQWKIGASTVDFGGIIAGPDVYTFTKQKQ